MYVTYVRTVVPPFTPLLEASLLCVNSPPVASWLGNIGSAYAESLPEPLNHLGIVSLSKVIFSTTYCCGLLCSLFWRLEAEGVGGLWVVKSCLAPVFSKERRLRGYHGSCILQGAHPEPAGYTLAPVSRTGSIGFNIFPASPRLEVGGIGKGRL
jgi:hypothetical protein